MTTVKFIHSAMPGAPVLSGQAGALIAVLDACLVNGFGTGTVDSLVVAGGVATVTRGAGHPFEADAIAEIAGATVTGGSVNGAQRVLSATSSAYTFAAAGIPDQTATGTITHKVAALGWAKTFSATNLAAYKPTDLAATGCLLRVDDTGTTNARVVGYESMSDVNTGAGPFPTATQISGGGFWGKSATADATARPWMLVGDSRGFYLAVMWLGSTSFGTQCFGDFLSYKSPDPYGCALSCPNSSQLGFSPGTSQLTDLAHIHLTTTQYQYAARGVSGTGQAVSMVRAAFMPLFLASPEAFSGATANTSVVYPNLADNGLYLSQMVLAEISPTRVLRGAHPGAYFCPQTIGPSVFAHRQRVTGINNLPGRTLAAVNHSTGVMFIDITGPWR